MGDYVGHPFRGNQWGKGGAEVGTRVKYSESGLRPQREAASKYIRSYGERPEHRWLDEKLAKRGTIVGHVTAEKDIPNIMRKKGDFVAYQVKFEGETGVHHMSPHLIEKADEPKTGYPTKPQNVTPQVPALPGMTPLGFRPTARTTADKAAGIYPPHRGRRK